MIICNQILFFGIWSKSMKLVIKWKLKKVFIVVEQIKSLLLFVICNIDFESIMKYVMFMLNCFSHFKSFKP